MHNKEMSLLTNGFLYSPWYTVLYPIPIPPKGTGRVFEKCQEFYMLPETRQRAQLKAQHENQDI